MRVSQGLHSWKCNHWLKGNVHSEELEWVSLAAQLKNPPAMQETLVQFLGGEDPTEKGQATHSSIHGLPWWFRR